MRNLWKKFQAKIAWEFYGEICETFSEFLKISAEILTKIAEKGIGGILLKKPLNICFPVMPEEFFLENSWIPEGSLEELYFAKSLRRKKSYTNFPEDSTQIPWKNSADHAETKIIIIIIL